MLQGLDEKNPQSFLKRIDPEDYYPVYGDDSVAIEDAPTSGKFYVRVERGDSRVVWGNFKTDIRGTEFLRNDRALYGANVVLKTDKMVPSGERPARCTPMLPSRARCRSATCSAAPAARPISSPTRTSHRAPKRSMSRCGTR